MNHNKVIKDLKERNDKLQEQYRLRDIRCIHLEYENEMLKNDFEAQHELTKKYAEENQELKIQLEESKNDLDDLFNQKQFYFKNMQLNQLEMCKMKHQQKEFIEMLEKEILDSKAGSSQQYYAKEHLRLFKEIIGSKE